MIREAHAWLARPVLDPRHTHQGPRRLLSADQLRTRPDGLANISDPRRAQCRRHRLPTVRVIASAAVLSGRRGYQALAAGAGN
ncbi:MAG: hypothetical protein KA204_10680 [Chromatiaceae bacterium]|nr:hypothetical protein [Chromatiaceae bacterium]